MDTKIGIKQNLHTHSIYCDGKDSIEEMIQEAISRNFTILGFSGHGHLDMDSASMSVENTKSYIQDVIHMKEKYKDKISIHLGIEQDMLGRMESKSCFEYVIGSKHFIGNTPIDYSIEVFEQLFESYQKEYVRLCKDYYEELAKMSKWQEVDIIGHIDLITKYNEDESFWKFDDSKYVSFVCDCIDQLLTTNKIFEVNTGAIARGYRTTSYPYINILKYLYEHQARICLNSDCHDKTKLDCAFVETLDTIRSCGFKEMTILTNQGFKSVDIHSMLV